MVTGTIPSPKLVEMGGRAAWCAHPLEKSAPSFTKGITMGSERLRRRLAVVRFQFAEFLDTLDAPHQLLQLVTGLAELDRSASRVQRLSLLDLRE
jgi:hypothetical protein